MGGHFPGSPAVKTLISNTGSVDSIPGQGAQILHALGPKTQNIKQKQYCNKFNKDFKMVHIKKNLQIHKSHDNHLHDSFFKN